MNKPMKIKQLLLFLTAVFSIIACEKDLYEDAIQQNQDKQINIKQISLEKFNSKMRQMKNKPDLERFMVSSKNSSLQSRAESTSEFEIVTSDIKEITQGNYTSYTMYLKTPDTTSNIYNITIEEIDGYSSFFITKYIPTTYWLENKDQPFDGEIITYRESNTNSSGANTLQEYLDLINGELYAGGAGGGGSLSLTGTSSGTSWSSGLGGSPIYPQNCNGTVKTDYILEPHACVNGHMPGVSCEFLNPSYPEYNPSNGPYYELTPYYTCVPNTTSNGNTSGSGDTSGGNTLGGGGSGSGTGTGSGGTSTGAVTGSITTIVDEPTSIPTKKPCVSLNEALATDKQNLNYYINDLVTKHQQSVKNEVSYSFEKVPQYDTITDAYTAFGNFSASYKNGGPTSVAIEIGNRWYSSIHLHPKDQEEASGIFSWQDLRTFANAYNEVTEDLKSEVSMILVAPNPLNFNDYNVYALKVKDISLLSQAVANEWNSSKWRNITNEKKRLEAIQESLGLDYVANKNNLAQFFLQKFSNYGISLFQLQNNQWKELVLNNTTNQLEEKPCNN
ncbi:MULTISPECIES: hypothetical protein [unclassified Flavobacterium]|uniref:hypothetical protein n=1 Tax=unclassified Flavobacterium TaxID=196869 RepID=UPI001292B7A7|nr:MULTISPECIES: hypothetical protein [unclassified Flavobacterium]MQP53689.1 hypothetical protein [Flavobacterium sp. LMO9]MQP63607.1 hypothetical protein [Flavobacterium sp. LMO6]